MGHSCRTLLWATVVGHSCGTLLWGTLVAYYYYYYYHYYYYYYHYYYYYYYYYSCCYYYYCVNDRGKQNRLTAHTLRALCQVSKTSVSYETPSKSHTSSFQSERLRRRQRVSRSPVARHHVNALSTKAAQIPMALRHHKRRVATRPAQTLEANVSHDATQTHFPPRLCKSPWHCDITNVVPPHGLPTHCTLQHLTCPRFLATSHESDTSRFHPKPSPKASPNGSALPSYCGRLRTVADGCEHRNNGSRTGSTPRPPELNENPSLRIREKVYALICPSPPPLGPMKMQV